MNLKTILIMLGVVAAVVGFLIFTQPADDEQSAVNASQHTVGAGNDGVTLVEYGDFQCPACAQYFPVLQQVKEEYGDRITFQFRHFPLEAIHPNARAASRAAEAASIQGMFWEMHDHLFTYQSEWQSSGDPLSIFERYAQTIGIPDTEKFKEDYRSSEVNAIINADLSAGRNLGVQSTPTFVLNDRLLESNPSASFEAFKLLIDEALGADVSEDTDNQIEETIEAKPEENQ
jgi:protein-disulfide isomerase